MAQEYWLKREGKMYGPYSGGRLKKLASEGKISPSDQISADKRTWQLAEMVRGLSFRAEEKPQQSAAVLSAPPPLEVSPRTSTASRTHNRRTSSSRHEQRFPQRSSKSRWIVIGATGVAAVGLAVAVAIWMWTPPGKSVASSEQAQSDENVQDAPPSTGKPGATRITTPPAIKQRRPATPITVPSARPALTRNPRVTSSLGDVDRQLRAVISKYVSHPVEVEKLMPKARAVRRQTVVRLQAFTDAWFIGKLDSLVGQYIGRGTPAPAVIHMALDSLVATAALQAARRGKQQSGQSDRRQPLGDDTAAAHKRGSVKTESHTHKELTLDIGKGVTMKLVLIPAGKFLMGSPATEKGRGKDEGPQRQVTISKSFYIGAHEVTQAQWRAVMGTEPWKGRKWTKSGDSNAASHIRWGDTSQFCKILSEKTGKQVVLPTEAQWEYACRAGSETAYSFGDDTSQLGGYAWYRDNAWENYEKYTHAVGQKKPNVFGLYDMHGNVYEWCRDGYDEKSYVKAQNVDPENTTKVGFRVLRGGAFSHVDRFCRSAYRCKMDPDCQSMIIGFRVVVVSGSGVD